MTRSLPLILALALAGACGRGTDTVTSAPVPADPSSFANVSAFVTTHLVLDLTTDFETKTLRGTVELMLDRRDPAAVDLVLDTRDLTIQKVEAAVDRDAFVETTHRLDAASPAFGSALHITMPPGSNRVRISYATSPAARGLQWLTPAQTAAGKHPFLFSQAQAIQARSFVPVQDLPGVRVTYDATIRTPKALVAVMAAESLAKESTPGVYKFRMPQPIPSYLLALAVGDLVFKPMSDRTGVWAEPSMVDAAAREFEDTEEMIQVTEQLYGPYRWGRYDLLVLPPSFPFGGMENPRVTFATPTVITGDKSLVSLVAHELAHSWSGNLVTNATWSDFWLNEGFTTYLERRIVEAVYGKPRADMEAMIGVRELEDSRKTLDVPKDRTLLPDMTGRDPDDAYSTVPYEQGALFLTFLEAKFGRDILDAFLRRWFDGHAFQSATTDAFLKALRTELMARKPDAITEAHVQEWLHSETVPPFAILPKSDAFTKVEGVRDVWLKGGATDVVATAASAWSTQEWVHFIDSLPRQMSSTRMSALDKQFALTSSSNAEIAHVWYRLAIANQYTTAYGPMEQYLLKIGRRKLILPLYRDLAATPTGRRVALGIYGKARVGYHPLAQSAIDDLLK